MADVVVRFVSDAGELLADLNAVEGGSASAGASLGTMATAAGTLAAGMLAAGAAVFSFTQHLADTRNALTDMAARTGETTKTLSGLELAAKGSGLQLADLEAAIGRAAKEGLKIEEVVSHLQSIEDPGQRAAEAMELMGRNGGRLIQALGDQSLQDFADFAETFGQDTGPEAAKAAAEWQRRIGELETVITGLIDRAGTPLLEMGAKLVENFTRGLIFVGEVGTGVFNALSRTIGDFVSNLETSAIAVSRLTRGDLAGAWEALGDIKEPAETTRLALKDITDGFASGIEKADEYTRFVQGLGDAGSIAADGLGEAAAAAVTVVDETENVIDVIGKAKAEFGDWLTVAGLGVDLVGAMGDTIEAFGQKSTAAMKAAFIASRAAAIGEVIVKTAVGIMNAFATLPTPAAAVAAPLIAATGALQLATVVATSFGGGGSGASAGASSSGAAITGAVESSTITSGIDANGTRKFGGDPDNLMRRAASTSGAHYRHRDLDIVARDSRAYPGGAFDMGGSTGQSRYERG